MNSAALRQEIDRLTKLVEKHSNLRIMWRSAYSREAKKLQRFQDTHICYPKEPS